MKKITLTLIFFTSMLFISCDKICENDNNKVGPCVHEYREAIFHITALTDSASGSTISFASISNLKINGNQHTSFFGSINYGIVSADGIFYCNFPCGFGIEPGSYEFDISADGYKTKHVIFNNIDYSIYEGGCPSYNDGGVRVTITMSK